MKSVATGCLVLLVATGCSAVPPAGGQAASPTIVPTVALPVVAPLDLHAEAQTVADLLELALAQYRTGDAELAMDTVADAYIYHYELVEHSGAVALDVQYMLDLELLIATTIRGQMRDGAPVDAVAALIEQARSGLAQVQGTLE